MLALVIHTAGLAADTYDFQLAVTGKARWAKPTTKNFTATLQVKSKAIAENSIVNITESRSKVWRLMLLWAKCSWNFDTSIVRARYRAWTGTAAGGVVECRLIAGHLLGEHCRRRDFMRAQGSAFVSAHHMGNAEHFWLLVASRAGSLELHLQKPG